MSRHHSHAAHHFHPVDHGSLAARLALLALMAVAVLMFVAGINAFDPPPSLVTHPAAIAVTTPQS